MASPLSNTKIRIPKGLQSLLVGLSTEVLRNQPKDIHAFAADYFERLLQKRDQGQPYLHDQQSTPEDRYYNNQSFQNQYLINEPDVNSAATKIQATFRGHKTRKDLEKIKEENKQINDFDQDESSDDDQEKVILKSSFDDASEEIKERAATSIQAQFRGYQVRKSLQEKLQDNDQSDVGETDEINQAVFQRESADLSEDFERHTQIPRNSSFEQEHLERFISEDNEMSDLNLDQAATRIQASYRGYKARKELGSNSIGPHSNSSHDQYNNDNTRNTNILSSSAEDNKVPFGEDDGNAAAVKIQAAYRGYRVRKDLEK